MTKEDTRNRLIEAGARIVHEKGFRDTGIKEILEAAGVPRGSFYFYFKSKDEFGLALVDFYAAFLAAMMDRHLEAPGIPHIQRLKGFFDEIAAYFGARGCTGGCPVGNMAQELADDDETFREKLKRAMAGMEERMAACMRAAAHGGELREGMDPAETAAFILNSWEGALLRMKAEKSLEPLVLFDRMVFSVLLRS
jgi:TetR/AcrR family transcriptional regulator, transcriptional repressor for nem operon